jgi:hypothetical protein
MMTRMTKLALAVSLLLTAASSSADEQSELVRLRATTTNLIDMLVEEGVITRDKADRLIERAQQTAEQEVASAPAATAPVLATGQPEEAAVVRVPYVPEFIKEEIRAQVRAEVKDDVVKDVMQQAKTERWGTPDALPDWLSRISFNGDIRLRYQGDYYADENIPGSYIDWQQVNQSGGVTKAGQDAFLNITEDDNRMRERLRLGMDAQINEDLKAGLRLTTGNTNNPVSTNQTLGNYNNRYQVVLDEAYLNYALKLNDGNDLAFWGGRFPNPFFSSDLVWDTDVGFEGGALSYRTHQAGAAGNSWQPSLFVTAGGFVVQENQQYCDTKWLYAAQLGGEWAVDESAEPSRFKLGMAYYDYSNIEGVPNALGSQSNDCTAPQYIQKGNSLMRISNDVGESPSDPRLVGLSADFNILNITAAYDIARFAPAHLVLSADYARNLGFDEDEILQRTGDSITPRVDAYQVLATLGMLKLDRYGDWQAFAGYKRLERDSVLDAFTDSDFHGGGTDAKGWLIGGNYGLMENTWLTLRMMSADEIHGPPLGVSTLQLDLNARF